MFYLDWYEATISSMRNEFNVIDATEGAKIKGTHIMKLSDAIQEYCIDKFDFKKMIQNLKPTFDNEQYLEVRQDIMHMKNEFLTIEECAKKGLEASKSILKKIKTYGTSEKDNSNIEIEYRRIVKNVNEIIEKQLAYSIVERDIIKDVTLIMRGVNVVSDDNNKNLKKSAEISKFVYEKILESVNKCMPMLCEALKMI